VEQQTCVLLASKIKLTSGWVSNSIELKRLKNLSDPYSSL